MKKILLTSLSLLLLLFVFSCKEKTREQRIHEFQNALTKQDTLDMLKLADDAMLKLKNNQIDAVISSLYTYNEEENSVIPLEEKEKARIKKSFTVFPVQNYERRFFSFQLEGCNDVNYTIEFDTVEHAKTQFMFNPVKIDGVWYLTVKNDKEEVDMSKR